jgi:hypothetical protein
VTTRHRRESWQDYQDRPPQPREVRRWLMLAGVTLFIVVPTVIWVISMLSRPAQIANRVTDPGRLIASYEGYYDKCTAIVAYDANIADAKQAYADARKQAGSDPLGLKAGDVQQARTNLQGLTQRRREVAAEYNSQSLQITRLNGVTKGDDLPSRIDEGVTPQCGTNQPEIGP